MKRSTITCILLLIISALHAQVRLIDSLTAENVVGANIYTNKGLLIATSDEQGLIHVDTLKNITSDTLTIQHIGYENKEFHLTRAKESRTISLNPRKIEIAAIEITNENQLDYVVLKTYFRRYDIFNNKSKYFIDGIIEHYIPVKDKREKSFRKIIGYRIFVNEETVKEQKDALGKFFTDPPAVAHLDQSPISENLPKDFDLVENGDMQLITKDGVDMGLIQKTKSGLLHAYLNEVAPGTKISRKFLSLRGEQYKGVTIEQYSDNGTAKPTIENLISRTRISLGAIKRKSKAEFIPAEGLTEQYVLDRHYVGADEVKKMKDAFTSSIYLYDEKSKYTDSYWLDLERHNIPALAPGIAKQLGTSLHLAD